MIALVFAQMLDLALTLACAAWFACWVLVLWSRRGAGFARGCWRVVRVALGVTFGLLPCLAGVLALAAAMYFLELQGRWRANAPRAHLGWHS